MEFEDILKDVGDFGRYQILLTIIFLVPVSLLCPWISFSSVFIASTPDHWCRIPSLEPLHLSHEDQTRISIPLTNPQCQRYDINYTNILEMNNFTMNRFWPVISCDKGWEYDRSNYDETVVTKWDLVCDQEYLKNLVTSLTFVGQIFGTPINGFLSDRYGRKRTFLGITLLLTVSQLASAFSPNIYFFLACRVLIGSTMTSLYSLGYIMLLELVRPNLRGRVNGIATNAWTAGLCFLPLIGYLTRGWFYLTIIMAVTSGISLLYFKILLESPSWLISRGKCKEAADVLMRVSKMNNVQVKHEQLLQNIQIYAKLKQEEQSKKVSPVDFMRYRTLRERFILYAIVWIGVALSYYGLQFNVSNLSGSEFFNFFLLAIVEIPAHLVTWWMLNNIGRKKSLQFGFAVTGVSCLIPMFLPDEYKNVEVVICIIAKGGAGAAFMAHYQLGPEIFPTSLRGIGMGLSSTIGTGCNFIVPYIVDLKYYGSYAPFLFFAVIAFIAGICSILLPETLNKNLPQTIEDMEKLGKNDYNFPKWCTKNKQYALENNIIPHSLDPVAIFSISDKISESSTGK